MYVANINFLCIWKKFFIFFTADWCMPCKEAEDKVFSDPTVRKYLTDNFVLAKINVDQLHEEEIEKWDIGRTVPKFRIVPLSWHGQIEVNLETKDPMKFLNGLKSSHSMMDQNQTTSTGGSHPDCRCWETGVCICGDDCQCVGCPIHTDEWKRLKSQATVLGAINTLRDRVAALEKKCATPVVTRTYSRPIQYTQPVYYSHSGSNGYYGGGCSNGNCSNCW